jgi:hypothetical protein
MREDIKVLEPIENEYNDKEHQTKENENEHKTKMMKWEQLQMID